MDTLAYIREQLAAAHESLEGTTPGYGFRSSSSVAPQRSMRGRSTNA